MSRTSDDLKLQRDVIEELEWDPAVDAAHIGVSARDGVVTLTGHVPSFSEKLAAESAARRVRGVKAVAQDMEVELPSSKKTADDEIAARAVKMLEWDVVVPPGRIAVTVDHGIVTLAGQVDWKYQRDEAEADIWKLTGVKDVVNTVKVRPQLQPTGVQERIRKALQRSADIAASHVSVAVRDGKVVLTGTVGAWIERQAAERAAWAGPGVIAVENKIKIGRP
jgi:osmotically-inducible protein OsmY